MIDAKLEQLGIPLVNGDLDTKLNKLTEIGGENIVGSLLRACRETLAFHALILTPELHKLISIVTNLKMPQIISETCMLRVDRHEASSRDFAWHYDAAYTAQPPQAVICWIPLLPVDSQMGPLRLIPGSHKRLNSVRFHKEFSDKKLSGPKRIDLVDLDFDDLENAAIDICPVLPGDVVILHGWTLHRSGKNASSRARWIFNPRFSDLLDDAVLSNDWRVSRSGDPWVFSEYYPEFVKD